MQAVLLVVALFGAALADPPKQIHLPTPKVKRVEKLAHQEHAVNVVQAVPITKTVVRTVNVPKTLIQEVPIHVYTDLVLKSPVPRRKVIDIKKTVLQPHIRHVPVDQPYVVHRRVPVIHTKIVRQPRPVHRIVKIPKLKVVQKQLNRIIDVPQIVTKERIHRVIKPVPVERTRIQHVDVDVPMRVVVPEPVVQDRHTQSVETVPVPHDVVRKVKVPKTFVLKDLIPVPEKAGRHYSSDK
uniref:Valine-rich protein n=1 Tax=Margaritifera margaritifera TaxID=102329 RepID=VRP_PINMG|nr:RecName: Full=Valine-rich protein; AltName: Full=Alveoline-like protein; Flags: Precursor [Pinctada margaritifera]CCE46147.1 alveoline-like protein [Pinctada margaritifera]